MMEICCGTYSYCAGSPGNMPVNHLLWDEALDRSDRQQSERRPLQSIFSVSFGESLG